MKQVDPPVSKQLLERTERLEREIRNKKQELKMTEEQKLDIATRSFYTAKERAKKQEKERLLRKLSEIRRQRPTK